MSRACDVQLSVDPVDNQRSIADQCVTYIARFYMTGAIIEIDPPKVVFVNAHHYQFLQMPIVVSRQRRFKVESCDFVFIEKLGDYLVSVLASEHCVI